MIQKLIIPLILLGLIIFTGCKTREQVGAMPLPYQSLQSYMDGVTENWLDVRMDTYYYAVFTRPINSWEETKTLEELTMWFKDNLGTPTGTESLWNLESLIDAIQQTHHYQENPPLESQFLDLLKVSLNKYWFDGE